MIFKYVSRIFVGDQLEWDLTLRPEQVIELVAGKNEGSFIERMFAPGISAKGRDSRFSMSKMSIGNIPMSGNAFTHVLVGRVRATPTGSMVTARFRLGIPYFVFTTVWLGGAFLVGFLGGIASLAQMIKTGNFSQVGGVSFMILFPLFGVVMLNVSRAIAARNEREIRDTLTAAFAPYTK